MAMGPRRPLPLGPFARELVGGTQAARLRPPSDYTCQRWSPARLQPTVSLQQTCSNLFSPACRPCFCAAIRSARACRRPGAALQVTPSRVDSSGTLATSRRRRSLSPETPAPLEAALSLGCDRALTQFGPPTESDECMHAAAYELAAGKLWRVCSGAHPAASAHTGLQPPRVHSGAQEHFTYSLTQFGHGPS